MNDKYKYFEDFEDPEDFGDDPDHPVTEDHDDDGPAAPMVQEAPEDKGFCCGAIFFKKSGPAPPVVGFPRELALDEVVSPAVREPWTHFHVTSATKLKLPEPDGVAYDPHSNLIYVAVTRPRRSVPDSRTGITQCHSIRGIDATDHSLKTEIAIGTNSLSRFHLAVQPSTHHLAVCRHTHTDIFSEEGQLVFRLDSKIRPGNIRSPFENLSGVCFAANGTIHMTDYVDSELHSFDPSGRFIQTSSLYYNKSPCTPYSIRSIDARHSPSSSVSSALMVVGPSDRIQLFSVDTRQCFESVSSGQRILDICMDARGYVCVSWVSENDIWPVYGFVKMYEPRRNMAPIPDVVDLSREAKSARVEEIKEYDGYKSHSKPSYQLVEYPDGCIQTSVVGTDETPVSSSLCMGRDNQLILSCNRTGCLYFAEPV